MNDNLVPNLFEIANLAAKVYAGRNWHTLSKDEAKLVTRLLEGGFLTSNNPPNGFVGGATNP